MGLLDIIEKVYDIIENVSAKSGKNMTGFTNATMNSSTLSKQTPEQLEEQKKRNETQMVFFILIRFFIKMSLKVLYKTNLQRK